VSFVSIVVIGTVIVCCFVLKKNISSMQTKLWRMSPTAKLPPSISLLNAPTFPTSTRFPASEVYMAETSDNTALCSTPTATFEQKQKHISRYSAIPASTAHNGSGAREEFDSMDYYEEQEDQYRSSSSSAAAAVAVGAAAGAGAGGKGWSLMTAAGSSRRTVRLEHADSAGVAAATAALNVRVLWGFVCVCVGVFWSVVMGGYILSYL
jgi:hypothetical protein